MNPILTPITTETASGAHVPCTHQGQMTLRIGSNSAKIALPAVSSPNITQNLVSVYDITRLYGLVVFTEHAGTVYNTKHSNLPHILLTAPYSSGLYSFRGTRDAPTPRANQCKSARTNARTQQATKQPVRNTTPLPQRRNSDSATSKPPTYRQTPPIQNAAKQQKAAPLFIQPDPRPIKSPGTTESLFHEWHLKLNHADPNTIRQMALKRTLPTMPRALTAIPPHITCSSCTIAKQKPSGHKAQNHDYLVGEYSSSDTCGPIRPRSRHGNLHFLTFTDARSLSLILFFTPDRAYLASIIPMALNMIRNKHGRLRFYRTDNALEFQSKELNQFYNHLGIIYHSNTPHQPQENSIAERINETLMHAARDSLHHAGLDHTFWEDATRDVAFKYNIILHSKIGSSPHQLWHGSAPNPSRLFLFGQLGTIPIYSKKTKLAPRADPVRYMFPTSMHEITVFNLRTLTYQRLRAVDFKPYNRNKDPVYHVRHAFAAFFHPTPQNITHTTPPPRTHAQATRYPDAPKWAIAHNAELDAIDNKTIIRWLNEKETPDTKPISLIMSYRYKRNDKGEIIERKARCAVRGDIMRPHEHYDPNKVTTYVAERPTVRLIFALVAAKGLHLEHFDITAAFLHEPYQHCKPVYVRQFPHFDGAFKHSGKIGLLVGNLYETPAAGNNYFIGLTEHLRAHGYVQSDTDPCLFVRSYSDAGIIMLSITIDDFLVAASSTKSIDQLHAILSKKYAVKRKGTPKLFLNWKVQRDQNGIHISQPHAISQILEKLRMSDCNPTSSPYVDKNPANTTGSSTTHCPLC